MEGAPKKRAGKFGIELAPLRIPFERRVQTFGVIIYVNCVVTIPFVGTSLIIYGLFTKYWYLSLGYISWMLYDMKISKTHMRGGRRSEWMRTAALPRWIRDYFPIKLERSVDLDPKKNYIFGMHPHGVYGLGSMINFGSEATGFSETFPGIRGHLATLKQNLCWPFLREYLMWMGWYT